MGATEPAVGEKIGSYRLEALLGRGGMGSVYLASRPDQPRPTAVKILAPALAADPVVRRRFLNEARLLSEVDAPGVVDILDLVEQDEPPRFAYVMEFVGGPTLRHEIDRVALMPIQAARIGVQLVRALEAIHAQGVIHRDLRPSNIILTGELEPDTNLVPSAKLVDFGIARPHDRDPSSNAVSGLIAGGPSYLAPEQLDGRQTSWETDIYAVGAILHELFTRRRAFPDDGQKSRQMKLGRTPPHIDPFPFAGGSELASLISRCLEPEGFRRPSHRELIHELLEASALSAKDEEERKTTIDATPLPVPALEIDSSVRPFDEPAEGVERKGSKMLFVVGGLAILAILGVGVRMLASLLAGSN